MKFSIRDLLLVTVIVALVLGWGIDHNRSARMGQRAMEAESKFAVLEHVLRDQGWEISFAQDEAFIHKVYYGNEITVYALPISLAPRQNPPND